MNLAKKYKSNKVWTGLLLRGFIIFLSWLPLSLSRLFGHGIGRLLWWIPNPNKRVAKKNIQIAYPQLSKAKQDRFVKANLIETGKMITELGASWRWSHDKLLSLIKEVKGQKHLEKALAKKQGVILLAPHIGAWEMAGPYLSNQYPLTILYRPPSIPSMEPFMLKTRRRFGAVLVPTNIRGVRTLIKALKDNQISAILPDQDPGKSGSVYASFFNTPARTMTLVSKLIQKTDCAFLYMVMQRLPSSQGYVLHYLPADKNIASKDKLIATMALNAGVEACIKVIPEQYLWSYKRFRNPPKGGEDVYKK